MRHSSTPTTVCMDVGTCVTIVLVRLRQKGQSIHSGLSVRYSRRVTAGGSGRWLMTGAGWSNVAVVLPVWETECTSLVEESVQFIPEDTVKEIVTP
jgi:hypothetical protein